ncbi:hypothetical protein ILYODFUR_035984, partial [Ilyodon furcidens]
MHCVKTGLLCWSASSWICFSMPKIDCILTFLLVSVPGALGACSRIPELFITTPEKLEALSGSCLQMP